MRKHIFNEFIRTFLYIVLSLAFVIAIIQYTKTDIGQNETSNETDQHSHTLSVSREAVEAGPNTLGYSEEIVCKDCGAVISERQVTPATAYDSSALYSSDFYYNNLGNYSKAEEMKKLYESFEAAAAEYHSAETDRDLRLESDGIEDTINQEFGGKYKIGFELSCSDLSFDEMSIVWKSFLEDHPLYYWLGDDFYRYQSGAVSYIPVLVYSEYASAAARSAQNEVIYKLVEEIQLELAAELTVYDRALGVHNIICKTIDYKYDEGTPETFLYLRSVLGFFNGYGAVCDGYTKSYQLILTFMGIDCISVLNEEHRWNLVEFADNKWYWVDVTWDDNSSGEPYRFYFCRNDTENIWEGTGYHRPSAYTDDTFLGCQEHKLIQSESDLIYKEYVFVIVKLPDRAEESYRKVG